MSLRALECSAVTLRSLHRAANKRRKLARIGCRLAYRLAGCSRLMAQSPSQPVVRKFSIGPQESHRFVTHAPANAGGAINRVLVWH